MKRKVVKHGSATLTISLPAKWAKKFNIKQGDELEIAEENKKLVISCPGCFEPIKITNIDLDEYGLVGGRSIGALFKGGCDAIRINYTDPAKFSIVEKNLSELIGFEIMQQSSNSCLIKEVSGLTDSGELDSMIKRTFMMLISISEDFVENISKGNKEVLMNLVNRDTAINKFANFSRRLLNKKGTSKSTDVPMIYYIIEELENLGDEFKNAAKYLAENGIKITNPDTLKVTKDIDQLLRDFFNLYFKFSSKGANKLMEDRNKIVVELDALFNKVKTSKCVRVLDHLSRMVHIIINMQGPLLTMKLPEVCSEKASNWAGQF
ncbi:AbrB/MazE/SpoVT family DNA-binding domain-containing protein [Candidatus Woesearchaeota archaeon]|nr:AbrB/MazE/SpoVT family DNA-binding domain-containing protein [Candidatus Woesearchaeota archaeon]